LNAFGNLRQVFPIGLAAMPVSCAPFVLDFVRAYEQFVAFTRAGTESLMARVLPSILKSTTVPRCLMADATMATEPPEPA